MVIKDEFIWSFTSKYYDKPEHRQIMFKEFRNKFENNPLLELNDCAKEVEEITQDRIDKELFERIKLFNKYKNNRLKFRKLKKEKDKNFTPTIEVEKKHITLDFS